ncbi:MAG: Gfo/Idh/MocA family oxidoreductase [Opitutaceae bacterium]|nr:Gfo/Idh/MocA family oxidoreductase [Opitutaceae bacterium]
MNRRSFIQSSAAASALATFGVHVRAADKSGRRFRTALIGTGWWGGNILGEAIASRECEIVGLCDVDERQLESMAGRVVKLTSDQPRHYRDYRELLAREKPDIVIVATPDHWHALTTIAAVKAGAHVFVEKPIGHTIAEGRAIVNAARAAGRVVQVDTHRRSSPHLKTGREFIRSGKAGEIGMIRTFVFQSGAAREQPLPTQPVPRELDWNMWCGPAPLRPYNGGDPRNPDPALRGAIHPRGFRQYLDYANGSTSDIGVHWFDQILWITGQKWPRRVFSTGGRPIKGAPVLTPNEQTSDAPDHQVAHFQFENLTVAWETRMFGGNNAEKGEPGGCYFYGTKGTFHLGYRRGWTFYPLNSNQPAVHEEGRLNEPDDQNIREHWADFLDAIKTGRRPVSDIEDGHLSTNCALLAMISYRLGRSIEWDGAKERIVGDEAANKLLRRGYRPGWEYPRA